MTITITPSAYSLSKDPIIIAGNSAIDQTLHKARIQAVITFATGLTASYITNSAVWLELVPDEDGNFVFNLSGVLDEYIGNKFNAPDTQVTSLNACSPALVYFGVDIIELEDDVNIDGNELVANFNGDNNYIVLQAGTPEEYRGSINYMAWRALESPRPWQTWQQVRYVDKEMPSWLYFMWDSNASQWMRARVTLWANGVAFYNYGVYATLNMTRGLYQLNTGYTQLGIQAVLDSLGPNFYCERYDVDITDLSAVALYKKFTFYVNDNYYANKNYLYWQNGIFGFDEMMLTGEEVTKADYERTTGSLAWNINNQVEGLVQTFANRETYGKKIHTGILSPYHIDSLRGMLNSPRIYHFDGTDYRPIQLTEKSKEIIKQGAFLQHTTIEWRYAYKNKTYWNNNALT